MLDFQRGIGDQPWAQTAAAHARIALASARAHGLLVMFSKVRFEPGYLDVSPSNTAFWPYAHNDLLPPEASQLIDGFDPGANEALVNKNRFSPFAGSNLHSILRSQAVTHLILAGVSTSGVVLTALMAGENNDLRMTVLADACADPDTDLHTTLIGKLFPRSAAIKTTRRWATELSDSSHSNRERQTYSS